MPLRAASAGTIKMYGTGTHILASAAGRVFINGIWYEQMGDGARFEPMAAQSRSIEKIITGLRQTRGLLLAPDVKNALHMEYVNQHPDLLEVAGNRVRATKRGMLILDELVLNLVK